MAIWRFSRLRSSANVNFQSLTFVTFDCDYYQISRQRTKFSEIFREDTAEGYTAEGCWVRTKNATFYNMASVRHLEFESFEFWSQDFSYCSKLQNFIKMWWYFPEIWRITIFKMVVVHHHGFRNENFHIRPSLGYSRILHIWLQNLAKIGQSAVELWPQRCFSMWRPSTILNLKVWILVELFFNQSIWIILIELFLSVLSDLVYQISS